MHATRGNSRFAFWRRTVGVLAVLAVAAQSAPLFACAPDALDTEPGCDVAMDTQAQAEPTHLEHAAAPLDDVQPDAPPSGTRCGDDGMTGECVQQCVTVAIGAASTVGVVGVAPAAPVDRPASRLIGIPPAPDSPPPKG